MMTNLFSVFDPSSAIFSSSWMIIFLMLTFLTMKTWNITTSSTKIMKMIVKTFKKEVSFTLNKKEIGTELMILLIFIMILMMNFLALYPQIFSPTSHMTTTLPLSLMFWLTIVLFGWTKNTNHMMAHLLPQGTPPVLMMFMVMIELVSNIIRPITLCVRLTANLIAGHLLMSLLGGALMSSSILMSMPALAIPLLLTVLESAVACIQAYVFMTLITLYVTEIK